MPLTSNQRRYHLAVACFHPLPQRGLPGGSGPIDGRRALELQEVAGREVDQVRHTVTDRVFDGNGQRLR